MTRRPPSVEDPTAAGSVVHHDAVILLSGAHRLLDPPVQRVLDRMEAKAEAGIRWALSP